MRRAGMMGELRLLYEAATPAAAAVLLYVAPSTASLFARYLRGVQLVVCGVYCWLLLYT